MTTLNKRFFTTILISLCVLIGSTNVFAKSSESTVEDTNINIVGTPLTPQGNLTLVDDITTENESSKQFITAVSKSGNYFYMVIDRDGNSNNVYLLNLVDEADLFALMGEEYEPPKEEPVVVFVEPEPVVAVVEPEPEVEEKSTLSPLLMLILLAGVGGAFYYIKFIKPKSNDVNLALVDYDDDDDEFYEEDEEE